jgi:hypothetical protein
MIEFLEQIKGAVDAVSITSPTTYAWFGRSSIHLPRSTRDAFTPALSRPASGSTGGEPVQFVLALRKANAGLGVWEPGWTLRSHRPGAAVVYKDGLELIAEEAECRGAQPGCWTAGEGVTLNLPGELNRLSPGYYMAVGNTPLGEIREPGMVRLYWHVTPIGAIGAMKLLTERLNGEAIAFRFKTLNAPELYTRCDAAVLYLARQDWPRALPALEGVLSRVRADIEPGVPALTKPMAPGLGLAEDPGAGESFGLHRCLALAQAIVDASGAAKDDDRLERVRGYLATAGISLDAPYLNSGSQNTYEVLRLSATPRAAPEVMAAPSVPPTNLYLHAAEAIGQYIARTAVWHDGRCNWLGTAPDPGGARGSTQYSALGGDLYGGTSGIALFLSQLHASAPDDTFRRTALGAIRHALASLAGISSDYPPGLYVGWSGIAAAAMRVGTLLGDPHLADQALAMFEQFLPDVLDRDECDLMSGAAGTILAILDLHRNTGDTRTLDSAVALGERLLAAARGSGETLSWTTRGQGRSASLTGLSHGVAGIVLALAELRHATGDDAWRTAAIQAMAWERRCFNKTEQNWPDLRGCTEDQAGIAPCAVAWCHGAPGIALSRLRAWEILGDQAARDETHAALATTMKMTRQLLEAPIQDFSLCHGLSGNADILLEGTRILGGDAAEGKILAHAIGNFGLENFGEQDRPWPCGTGGGPTPSLMLGLAGIGHFYLRLWDDRLPTVLLWRPGELAHQARSGHAEADRMIGGIAT